MGYTVPDWKQSVKQNTFPVTVGKKTYELPKAKYISGAFAERMQEGAASGESMYNIIDELCPGLGTAFRDIPVVYFQEMLADWQKDSGITLGESPASVG